MSSNQEHVRILGKEYAIACPVEERHALHDCARLLDEKMRAIHQGGKIVGLDRIAVMAALNLAHELLKEKECGESSGVKERLKGLQEKIEAALEGEDPQLPL